MVVIQALAVLLSGKEKISENEIRETYLRDI